MNIISNKTFIVLIMDRGTHPNTVLCILTVVQSEALLKTVTDAKHFSNILQPRCECRWNNHHKNAKMTSKLVECKNNPDDFCYVCGEYNSAAVKKPITNAHKKAYLAYFGFGICDQNIQWVPHFLCKSCHLGLLKWMNDCGGGLNFVQPMCWREPHDHNIDCYFCLTQIDGATGKVKYANVMSVTKPIANNLPINTQLPSNCVPTARVKNISEPQLILPNELDLLISGLDLSERSAEILVKTFQEWKILAPFPGFHRRKVAQAV